MDKIEGVSFLVVDFARENLGTSNKVDQFERMLQSLRNTLVNVKESFGSQFVEDT